MLIESLAVLAAVAGPCSPDLAETAFSPQETVAERIAAICRRSNGLAHVHRIGESLGGRTIEAVAVAADATTPPEQRPGILILAGLHGRHRIGTELAVFHLERLVSDFGDGHEATRRILREHVVWLVPEVNPDGPALDRIGNARPLDLDRDGRQDEDAPHDLDGDGVIAQMRWPDPDGEWLVDPDDARLVREADTRNGERGDRRVAVEALDADGDGERGEDDAQGVHVHRSFPHHYAEFDRRTGAFPTSEPETRALADFVFGHRNLVMAFVWDADDNLLATPKTDKPKDRTQLGGVLEADVPIYTAVGELYRARTGRTGSSNARLDGSVWSWLHFQVGIPAFASDVWRVPEGEGEGHGRAHRDAVARLQWCEKVGRGFVAWRRFEHPELGPVEIGGFVLGQDHRLLPEGERSTVCAAHHGFLLEAIERGPDVRVRSLVSEPLGDGAFRIVAVVVNEGSWPALTGTGERSRRFSTPRFRLEIGDAALLAGEQRGRTGNLAADGGREELSWIVAGESGTAIRLEVTCDPVGSDAQEVTL